MALAISREIQGKDFLQFIEHSTGKKVLSWREAAGRFGREVYFTDGTMCYLDPYVAFDFTELEYMQIPKSICVSCGEEAHVSSFDRFGRCQNRLTEFYKNMRKVYWHRYSKNK